MAKLPEHVLTLKVGYSSDISHVSESPDYSQLVDHLSCSIEYLSMEEFPAEPIIIGYMRLYQFNLGRAINNRMSLFDLLDEETELSRVLIDEETDDFKETIVDQIGDVFSNILLVGEEFIIYPEFRNIGLGEEALRGLIKHFDSKVGYIAFKSFPLQFSQTNYDPDIADRLKFNELEKDRRKAQKSLNAFYRRCGFTAIKRHPNFFIKNTERL